jgi:hypothetical protein
MDVLKGVLPLAVVHTLGNLLTNISLGAVSVSFTHTIKARVVCAAQAPRLGCAVCSSSLTRAAF